MIIFLNGSINAGKSTVARLLAEKLPHTALVEVDVFHDMIPWMLIEESVPLNLENAVAVIRNFAKRNLNVIVPYPLSQKNYEYMLEQLKEVRVRTQVFTLAPTQEIILKNRGQRVLAVSEKERIKHHYATGIVSPKFGEIINNSHQTPEQTAELILSKIS